MAILGWQLSKTLLVSLLSLFSIYAPFIYQLSLSWQTIFKSLQLTITNSHLPLISWGSVGVFWAQLVYVSSLFEPRLGVATVQNMLFWLWKAGRREGVSNHASAFKTSAQMCNMAYLLTPSWWKQTTWSWQLIKVNGWEEQMLKHRTVRKRITMNK